jgi:hypothetical protein
MSISQITPYSGTIPNKITQTANEFHAACDTVLNYQLNTLVPELITFSGQVNSLADEICVNAETATTKAQEAYEYAQSALNTPETSATSTTSLTIGKSIKSLTVQTGKHLVVGMSVKIAHTAAPATWMHGDITAYNPETGALTVNVTTINGSGTQSMWTVSLSAPVAPTQDRLAKTLLYI